MGLTRRTIPIVFVAPLLCLLFVVLLSFASPLRASMLPPGFSETTIATHLDFPTAMAFAPDGRIFVSEQKGALRVIKNNVLLATPFVSVTTDSNGERGLLGVAIHPKFPTKPYIYVYYTVPGSPPHNRLSRFTANGDLAQAGSEEILVEFEDLGAQIHNAGALDFGPDGKLYVAVGENDVPANAQLLSNRLGKMLRYNDDGTIPTDNPFFDGAGPNADAIWALGLRNPFTFAFQPGTGRMFINDVGWGKAEEINEGIAGKNYGWNTCEGPCSPPNANFMDPVFSYLHSGGEFDGCAITGGAFYNPGTAQFPADYAGDYFYGDLCGDFIRRYDPVTGEDLGFIDAADSPLDFHVSANGALYYLARGQGHVRKVTYSTPDTRTPTRTMTPTKTPTVTRTPSVTPTPSITPRCLVSKPVLRKPDAGATVKKARVKLDWLDVPCATTYRVKIRKGGEKLPAMNTTVSKYRTGRLKAGRTYQFRVIACNEFGCERSEWRTFTMAQVLK